MGGEEAGKVSENRLRIPAGRTPWMVEPNSKIEKSRFDGGGV